jgi:hypothetical protein
VVAVNLDAYVEDFKESKPHSKKLTFTLLRYALESNPSSLNFILEQVVGLPKEMQDEFAALLQKTSLIAMINASKIVTERLDFLKGLEYLLYDPQSRATVKERSQLHKLISRNTWIFGDEFYLVNNDESLTNVLRKHVQNVAFEVDLDTRKIMMSSSPKSSNATLLRASITSSSNSSARRRTSRARSSARYAVTLSQSLPTSGSRMYGRTGPSGRCPTK